MRINQMFLITIIIVSCASMEVVYNVLASIQSLASQLASQVQQQQFNLKTVEGFNMDCLKAIKTSSSQFIGVFHSSIEQSSSGYNALYLSNQTNKNWNKIIRLSQRGSQGTIYQIPKDYSFLVLYELQNHQQGNTIAIRYYETAEALRVNNFLYQYQLSHINDGKKVINLGTPSIDSVEIVYKEISYKFNQIRLNIKYHYCPDGQNDYPGYGYVNLKPLRDFVNAKGVWVGGCKENYTDWQGNSDTKVEDAIRKIGTAVIKQLYTDSNKKLVIGLLGKIGQRDMFELLQDGKTNKYYLYQVNINKTFDWRNWRIVLYSDNISKAIMVPFNFNQVEDLANPHISQLTYNATSKKYTFWASFFIPSEGVKPNTGASAGEFTAILNLQL